MGGELTCRSCHTSWRRVPEEIGWALRIEPAELVCVLRLLWTMNGEPAACATTYLPADQAARFLGGPAEGTAAKRAGAGLSWLPLASSPELREVANGGLAPIGTPRALYLEIQLPPPSVARSLRLSAGHPAAMVTVRFDDLVTSRPVGLTVTVLRPDIFRIVVQTAKTPLPDDREGSASGAWRCAVEDWEP